MTDTVLEVTWGLIVAGVVASFMGNHAVAESLFWGGAAYVCFETMVELVADLLDLGDSDGR